MSALDRLWQEMCARTDYERCERPRAARFRLDTIRELCAALGNPQSQVPALHVAGSKGKGTVCHYLSRGLQESGQRVGLYTSPHLSDWRERILIDGEPAADYLLEQAIATVLAASSGEETFFDLLTATAFLSFQLAGCTVQVLETGLGGRFDSTNVVAPLAAIVVTIEREHQDVLGDSLEAIAGEKAGIYKRGAQAWAGPTLAPEVRAVLEQAATDVGETLQRSPSGTRQDLPLAVQREDYALALAVLASLPAPFANAAPALERMPADALILPGRMEWRALADGRQVLFDVAHTEASLPLILAAFRTTMQEQGPSSSAVLLALRDDKNPEALARALAALGPRPAGEQWFTMPAGDHPRSADPGTIAVSFGAQARTAVAFPEGPQAFLVTGSTYLVGALRPCTVALPRHQNA